MKIREVFEYEIHNEETGEDITSLENVFRIQDYVEWISNMKQVLITGKLMIVLQIISSLILQKN